MLSACVAVPSQMPKLARWQRIGAVVVTEYEGQLQRYVLSLKRG